MTAERIPSQRSSALTLATLFFVFSLTALAQKDEKKPAQLQKEEQLDYFKKWLEEDVVYIITPEEKEVLTSLTTEEEKEHFVEQFWRRRDSDPRTALNEFKEEHYRRIAYANDRFHWGKAGWRTDRGRVYIMFGPPDGQKTNAGGSTYYRPAEEGGGSTITYPFEVWFYRHLPGIGSGIEVEFVDPTLTGEFRLALSSQEKDALLLMPGMGGETHWEQEGLQTRGERVRSMDLLRPTGLRQGAIPLRSPFETVERYFQLTHRRGIPGSKLKEIVTLQLSYQTLPYRHRLDTHWISEALSLSSLTLFIRKQDLTFTPWANDLLRAKVTVYGQVETLSQEVVFTFEDELTSDIERSMEVREREKIFHYQKRIPLRPGRYKLTLVVKDSESGHMGTSRILLVAEGTGEEFGASNVIVFDRVFFTDGQPDLTQPFNYLGGVKLYPSVDNAFSKERPLYAYLEVYNPAEDQSSGSPDVMLKYAIRPEDSEQVSFTDISKRTGASYGNRLVVVQPISLRDLEPGRYELEFRAEDLIGGKTIARTTQLEVKP